MWKNYNTVFVLLFLVFVSMPVTTARAAGGGSTTVTVNNVEFKDVSVRSSTDYTISFDSELLQVSPGASGHSYKDVTLFDVFIAFLNRQKNNQGQQVIYHHFEENGKYITGGYLEYRTDFGKVEYKISDTNRLKYAIIQTSGSVKTCLKYGDIPTDDSILIAPEFLVGTKKIFYFGSPDTILRNIEKAVDEFAPGYDDVPEPSGERYPDYEQITMRDWAQYKDVLQEFTEIRRFLSNDGPVLPGHEGTEDQVFQQFYAEYDSYSNTRYDQIAALGFSDAHMNESTKFNLYFGTMRSRLENQATINYAPDHHSILVFESGDYYELLFDDYAYIVRFYKGVDQFGSSYRLQKEHRYYYHLKDIYEYKCSHYLEYPDASGNPDGRYKKITYADYQNNYEEVFNGILKEYTKYYRFHTTRAEDSANGVDSFREPYNPNMEPGCYAVQPISFDSGTLNPVIPDFRYIRDRNARFRPECIYYDTARKEVRFMMPESMVIYHLYFAPAYLKFYTSSLEYSAQGSYQEYRNVNMYYQMDNGLSSWYRERPDEKPDSLVTITPQNCHEYEEHLKAFMKSYLFHTKEGDPLGNAAIRSCYELYEEGKTPETLEMTPLVLKGDHFEIRGSARFPAPYETDVFYLDTISDTVTFQTEELYGSRMRISFDKYHMVSRAYNYLNNRMEESHFYYLQEDGILSSFYQEYPDHATNPKHPVTVKDVTLTTTDDALGLVMFAARNLEVNPAEFFHVTVYDVLTAFLDGQNLTYEFSANYAETHINSVSIKGPSLTITPDMEINLQYAIIRTEKGQKTCLKYGDIPRYDSIAVTPELCENCEIYFILGRDREKNLAYIKNKVNGFSPDYEDFPPPENLLAITSENYMENMDLLGPFFEKRQFHIAKGEPLTEDVTSFYEYYDPDTPPAVREESAVSFDGERFHVYLGNRYVYLRSAATSFETLELDTDTGVLSASASEKRYDLSFSGSSYHIQEHDLRTGSVVKEQYYYLQEDGVTSSFYAEYPEHPTKPGAPVEPDPDLTESQGLLLASTATVLSFSMLILNRIAQDPILSFWLACSLVGIGIYVVYRIKNAID